MDHVDARLRAWVKSASNLLTPSWFGVKIPCSMSTVSRGAGSMRSNDCRVNPGESMALRYSASHDSVMARRPGSPACMRPSRTCSRSLMRGSDCEMAAIVRWSSRSRSLIASSSNRLPVLSDLRSCHRRLLRRTEGPSHPWRRPQMKKIVCRAWWRGTLDRRPRPTLEPRVQSDDCIHGRHIRR